MSSRATWPDREFDVVVYGVTGFTGRLVAEYLLDRYGATGEVRWAVAGRDIGKMRKIVAELGAGDQVPMLAADASDLASLTAMAERARVVITTVGPYPLLGEGLIQACIGAGTDCVDLNGDPAWLAAMIGRYDQAARAAGARIVSCCGFDSIPSDLGVFLLQKHMRERFGAPARRVRGQVRSTDGAMSGGTAASIMAMIEGLGRDPSMDETLSDPFALAPGFVGPDQPDGDRATMDPSGVWAAPFVMAMINTKVVHRTNALLGHPYGEDFLYDEMVLTGPGPAGRRKARAGERMTMARMPRFLPRVALFRHLIRRMLPKAGSGPSKAAREKGSFEMVFIAEGSAGHSLAVCVKGDKDPGYGSTCGMIAESALCLVEDVLPTAPGGGFWTPASALGERLIDRLQAHAGLTFSLEHAGRRVAQDRLA